jgi:hypothetical protein
MRYKNPDDDVRFGELFSVISDFDVITDDDERETVEKGNVVEYIGPSGDLLKFMVHLSGEDTYKFDIDKDEIKDFIEEIE